MNMTTNGMQVGIAYTLNPSLFLGGQPLLYSSALLHAQLPSEREIILETSLKDIQNKYEALLLENQDLKNRLEQSSRKTSLDEGKTQNSCGKRSFVRRTEDQLDKKYKCCFDHCKKEYASTLALNLHIKNKHHGTTKKQMDEQARKVIEAELRGEQPPCLPFSLPQGYLDKLRKQYTAAPSISEDLRSLSQ